ncbi:hypothetical protein MTR_4g086230 [Medicago truncatula]|uniref:Uncharacterized protein n=1 Tax=Medicago truncatula TaxID=3880 RepID=G7JL94_MEDTR|nr:hypothetical protein MTR_4g086230 [Medicago truncatula]
MRVITSVMDGEVGEWSWQLASGGVVVALWIDWLCWLGEEENAPFFPITHHDITTEIPVHAQWLQCLSFASCIGGECGMK